MGCGRAVLTGRSAASDGSKGGGRRRYEDRGPRTGALPQRLIGADDLVVLCDENVVRPCPVDVVDLVLSAANLHNTVDDASRVGAQRGSDRVIRFRSADDRPVSLNIVRRDLTDLL